MNALIVKVQDEGTHFKITAYRSQGNTVSIVMIYGLDIQTSSGASSYLMGTRGSFPGGKAVRT
jgi:hypothetical protein